MDEYPAVGQMELDDMDFGEQQPVEPVNNSWFKDLETMQGIHDRTRPNNSQGLVNQQGGPQVGSSTFAQGLVSYSIQHNPIVSSVNTPSLTTHQSMAPDSESPAPSQSRHGGGLNSPVGTTATTHPQGAAQVFTPVDGNWAFNDDSATWNPFSQGQSTNSLSQFLQTGTSGTIAPSALHTPNPEPEIPLSAFGPIFDEDDGAESLERTEELYRLYQESIRQQEESKPHRCPVVGCDKAYKNLNGLKYHKTHGHQTHQLQDNGDGTYSIINPDTSAPYPGSQGMEKEKPYNCDVCGKRYKNLNGLKYVGFALPFAFLVFFLMFDCSELRLTPSNSTRHMLPPATPTFQTRSAIWS